jgi:hypothetical protein
METKDMTQQIKAWTKDSFNYTYEALVGKWGKWVALLIATIIVPCIYGYSLRVLEGETPAPDRWDWDSVFIRGIVIVVIYMIYAIPVMIFASFMSNPVGIILFIAVSYACLLFGLTGIVRYARYDSFAEAFNLVQIKETIDRIGWFTYIAAIFILFLIILAYIFVFFGVALAAMGSPYQPQASNFMLVLLVFLIMFILLPAVQIFMARYISVIYDSAQLIAKPKAGVAPAPLPTGARDEKFCKNCGAKVEPSSQTCPTCGEKY